MDAHIIMVRHACRILVCRVIDECATSYHCMSSISRMTLPAPNVTVMSRNFTTCYIHLMQDVIAFFHVKNASYCHVEMYRFLDVTNVTICYS
jgi:hypothetical protein